MYTVTWLAADRLIAVPEAPTKLSLYIKTSLITTESQQPSARNRPRITSRGRLGAIYAS